MTGDTRQGTPSMIAIVFDRHGGPEVLERREVSDPEPGHGQVRVKVAGCGVNHLDLFVRAGIPGVAPMPHILGSEISGTIDKLGPGVTGLNPGQAVLVIPGRGCGRCEFCHAGQEQICPDFKVLGNQRQGGYAEYVVVEAEDCWPVNDRWPLTSWAAVPLVFQTSWHMLFDKGRLGAGQTVLIESAGSGIGTAAIQIARLAGAKVIAVAGGEAKRRRLDEFGVDLAIDYLTDDVRKRVREATGGSGVDLVFAHVGGPILKTSLACLTRGGRLVTCGATAGPIVEIDLRFFFTRELTLSGAYLGTRADMDAVVKLVGEGKLRPVVDRVYPLSEFAEAHRRMAERDLFGKLVLAP
jgi:NADPH:quinone reductase-like Zn-dependent oxidoreductase